MFQQPAHALPALDDSPTIPHSDLPDCGPEGSPRLSLFADFAHHRPKPAQSLEASSPRAVSPFSPEYLLSTMAIKDAFPSLVLEAIDGGSVDAGTRARAARKGRVDTTRMIMGGSWRPFTQPERRSSDPEVALSEQRPPLKSHHTSPPSLSSSSSSSGSGPSSPAQLLFPAGSHRLGASRRYHTIPPPIQVHSYPRPTTPLHSIPETPKDLDISPEGSWALRQSRTLGKSRSHPNLRLGRHQLLSSVEVHDAKLKRSSSSSGAKGDAVERKKRTMMAVLQMRRGSGRSQPEPASAVLMARVESSTQPGSTPKPKTPSLPAASPLRRSPRIQSLTSAIPKHIRLGSFDLHAPSSSSPLANHASRARSSSAPTPANQLRERLQKEKEDKEKVVSSQSASAIIPASSRSTSRGVTPPKLVLSREEPSRNEGTTWKNSEISPKSKPASLKSEMAQDVFYTPEIVPCLTPDCDTPTEELVLGDNGRFTGPGMEVVQEEAGEEREELVIRPGSAGSEAADSEDDLDTLWAFPAPPTRSNPSTPCTPTYHREIPASPKSDSSPPSSLPPSPLPTSSFTSRSQPDLLLSFSSSAGLGNGSAETLVTPNTPSTPLKPGATSAGRKASSVMGAASASMVSLLTPNEFGSAVKSKGGRLGQLEKQEKGEKDDPKRFKTWTGSITKARKSMGKLWV
ncbi:hypothetical protein IAR50_001479 [Cryptococcus sp. DSM 104548]